MQLSSSELKMKCREIRARML